ncbi:hypothetical protein ACJ73_05957 [Blastomyces percursus]|uniref:Restriction of telomere capping protein 4 C-terminal domain-containing protein n=1 Tax=Blastomyces percursus TaxID=1658174 RepID=A0A1J9R4Y2_9EURO|nr:hypothetical protein ACJ73_05957 [Blastomyces percursus]
MHHFADLIHSIATTDPIVLNYGELTYAQEVLVPELLALLVQEDMRVDERRACQILEESEEIGELINDT